MIHIPIKRPDGSTDLYGVEEHKEPMTTVINNGAGGQRVVVPVSEVQEYLDRPYNAFSKDHAAKITNVVLIGVGEFADMDAVKTFLTDNMGYEILDDVL